MVSLYTSLRLLRLKDYEYTHTADIDCVKTSNKYCCTQYQYSDAKREYFQSQCSKCENQSTLHKGMQHVDKFLRSYKCLHVSWDLNQPLILFFSNGAIVSLKLNAENNTLLKIEVDETLCGRFLPSRIVDVILSENYIYVSYIEAKLSIIHINHDSPNLMAKMLRKKKGKIVGFEPKLMNYELCMQSPKPVERKLILNKDKNLLIVWWKNSGDDVWPWMPITYLTDRLTLFVYAVKNGILDLLYPVKVQNELLSVVFSKEYSYKFYCLEETKKDQDIMTNVCTYEAKEGHCELVHSVKLPINGNLIAFDWSNSEDKLIASDSTGVLVIYDVKSQSTTISILNFKSLPLHIAWHPQTCIALIVCRNNQIFCVDVALNLIDFKLCYKRNAQCGAVDISSFFSSTITVHKVLWQKSVICDTCLLFLHPEMSSFILLKLSLCFVSRCCISCLEIISQYLKCNEIDRVKLVYSKLNWEFNYDVKFQCLSKITNYLFRKPFTSEIECNLEYMLGSFYRSVDHIPDKVVKNLEPKLYHLARRFFHTLLRYNRFEKAWSVAVDLDSQDLFLDLYQIAKQNNENILAAVALHKAEQYETHFSDSSSESCQSCCSGSVSSSDPEEHDQKSEKWITFRTMYQEILNQIRNKSEDLAEINRVTKQIDEAVKKLNIYPNLEVDKNQFMFSSSVSYPAENSSRPLPLQEASSISCFETPTFHRHSKYATTPFCHKGFSMLLHKNKSVGSNISENLHESERSFSVQFNKDLNEKSLIDFTENSFDSQVNSEEPRDFLHSNQSFIDPKNPSLYSYPSLSSSHSKHGLDKVLPFHLSDKIHSYDSQASSSPLHFDKSRHETSFYPANPGKSREPKECVIIDKVYPYPIREVASLPSGVTAVFDSDSLIPMQSQSYASRSSINQVLHSSIKSPRFRESKKCVSSELNNSFRSGGTEDCRTMLRASFESSQSPLSNSLLELTLKPKVGCRTAYDNSNVNPVLDVIHCASPKALPTVYKDQVCDNDAINYLNASSQDFNFNSSTSTSVLTSKNDCHSGNIFDINHKLQRITPSDKVQMSQSEQKNTTNCIFSSNKSPINVYSHDASKIICDTQHSFDIFDNDYSVVEEESEEMNGTKIKLDHLGII